MGNISSFDFDRMIVILPILILLGLTVVLLFIRAGKPIEKRKNIIFSLIPGILAVVMAVSVGIAFYFSWQEIVEDCKRTYRDDICVDLPDGETKIVIKEWSQLQHTGADLYFVQNGNEQYLDAVYREGAWLPFANDKYEIVQNESEYFTIRWAKSQSDSEATWLEKTFKIPNGN